MWLSLTLGLLVLYTVDYSRKLYKNIRIAQRSKLPYFVVPFSMGIIPAILFQTRWFPYIVDNVLPAWLGDNLKDVIPNSRWVLKDRQVKRYGAVYLVVTPGVVLCNVSDAGVVAQITHTRGGWPKPVWQYQPVELYGPNVVTADEHHWARHRRRTAIIFNEKNDELVWKESIRLANSMIEEWQSVNVTRDLVVETTRDDIPKLTLNIFSAAGFGVRIPFKIVADDSETDGPYGIFQDTRTPPQGFDFTFRAVANYMSCNISTVILANFMMPKWVPRGLLPFLKQDFAAHRDLRSYIERLLSIAETEDSLANSNLIQGMLRDRATSAEGSFTDQEIISNGHIFIVAGHETTATTIRYALLLLALNPDAQEWVYQGIKEATKDEPADIDAWDQASVYPKLITPLCAMLETMRLFPPVVTVPKWTGNAARNIHYQGRDVFIEQGINLNLNLNGLHYLEEYWGLDVKEFSPQRWDVRNEKSYLARNADLPGVNAPGLEYPTIHKPVRGAYIPFSDGVRACLGKKFAQIEVVIALTVILRKYRIELAQKGAEGRKRAERALGDSVTVVALAMSHDVPLVFRERHACQ
ncbi:cytochrome P450 monooxygenase [Aspergillus pseudoustus]|uniref:Cytochrome P450 monooxygenase n=1 Tax=Aspergillus pseudoustus TaxID=1810923 RepID=A0ABR4J5S9_9EURO